MQFHQFGSFQAVSVLLRQVQLDYGLSDDLSYLYLGDLSVPTYHPSTVLPMSVAPQAIVKACVPPPPPTDPVPTSKAKKAKKVRDPLTCCVGVNRHGRECCVKRASGSEYCRWHTDQAANPVALRQVPTDDLVSEVGSVHTSQIRVVNTDAQAQYQDEFQTQFSTLCGLRALDHLKTRVCLEGGNYRGFGLKLGFPDETGFRMEGDTRGLYFSDLEGYLVPCGYLAPMEPEIETVHVSMGDDDDIESSADSTDVVVNNHTHFDDEAEAVPMEAEAEVVDVTVNDEANEIMEQMTALKSAINQSRQPAYDPMDTDGEPDDTPINVVESDVEPDEDDDEMEVENTPEYVTTPPLMMPLLTEEVIDTPAQSPVVPPTPAAPLKKEKKVKTKKPKKPKKKPDSTPKEPEVVDFETIFKDHLQAVGLLDDFNGEATEDAQYHPQGVYVGWEHDKISALELRLKESGYQSEIISEEDYEEEKWLVVRQMADI